MVVITYPRSTDKKTKKKRKRGIERLKKCLHQRVSLSVCTVCTWREVTFLPANQPTRQAFSPSLKVLPMADNGAKVSRGYRGEIRRRRSAEMPEMLEMEMHTHTVSLFLETMTRG